MSDQKFVPIDRIIIEEASDLKDDEGRFNPRGLNNQGFDPENMNSLRDDIRKKGLNAPLLVRPPVNGKYRLIAGERRLRSILGIVEEGGECFCIRTEKFLPASEVYLKVGVEVKVKNYTNEIEYLKDAIGENVLHEPLTDYDLLMNLYRMEKAGVSRAEQAKVMHRSQPWVSQSHSILNAHPLIVERIKKGKLSRTAAITFIPISSERIEAVLNRAEEITYAEAERKIAAGLASRDREMVAMEEANALLTVAQFTGDEQTVRKARRAAGDAGRKLTKANKLVNTERSGVITDANILTAAREVEGASTGIKRNRTMKEVRAAAEDLKKQIDEGEVVCPLTADVLDLEDAKLAHRLLTWVLNFQDDPNPIVCISPAYQLQNAE